MNLELEKLKMNVYGYLMSYTRCEDDCLSNSLHLAYSKEGKEFIALNSNSGICFVKNISLNKNDNMNGLKSPFIFRRRNNEYGLIAINNDNSYVYVFESKDLIIFTNENKIKLSNSDVKVFNVQVQYDIEEDLYVINWTDGNKNYENTTKDFIEISDCIEKDYEVIGKIQGAILPENALEGNVFPVTEEEYFKVVNKLGEVKNVSIDKVELTVEKGNSIEMPTEVVARYSDGSKANIPVKWDKNDLNKINVNNIGTYEVKGEVKRKEYINPFIEEKADPWITKCSDGYYYFTASYPMYGPDDKEGYSRVTLRRAKTIEGLREAKEVVIWDCYESKDVYRFIWAPEFHEIDGKFYIYYTGSINEEVVWEIRPHVLMCTNRDPMNKENWIEKGRFLTTEEDKESFKEFSLDVTYFENKGKHYVIWAQKDLLSNLYIATIDKEEPWKLTSKPMLLTKPEYAWERINENVNEGPAVIKKNGKIFVYYSASATGVEYCMGVLKADENSDLMDEKSWFKNPYPILTSNDVKDEFGPGHNSFTIDENGNNVFVYHARSRECFDRRCKYAGNDPLTDPCRHARIRSVHWSMDGEAILKMTEEQAVSKENRNIVATITIK